MSHIMIVYYANDPWYYFTFMNMMLFTKFQAYVLENYFQKVNQKSHRRKKSSGGSGSLRALCYFGDRLD